MDVTNGPRFQLPTHIWHCLKTLQSTNGIILDNISLNFGFLHFKVLLDSFAIVVGQTMAAKSQNLKNDCIDLTINSTGAFAVSASDGGAWIGRLWDIIRIRDIARHVWIEILSCHERGYIRHNLDQSN